MIVVRYCFWIVYYRNDELTDSTLEKEKKYSEQNRLVAKLEKRVEKLESSQNSNPHKRGSTGKAPSKAEFEKQILEMETR